MTIGTIRLRGKEYVIVPKKEYDEIASRIVEDAQDIKRAKESMRRYRKTGRGVTLEKLKRELGE